MQTIKYDNEEMDSCSYITRVLVFSWQGRFRFQRREKAGGGLSERDF